MTYYGDPSVDPSGSPEDAARGGAAEDMQRPVTLRLSRLVVIIIADIGQDSIDRFLLQESASGADAPALRERLMRHLRAELAREWQGAGMDLVGLVKSVVPFMPFAQVRAAGRGAPSAPCRAKQRGAPSRSEARRNGGIHSPSHFAARRPRPACARRVPHI